MIEHGDSSMAYFGLHTPDEPPSVAREKDPAAFLEVWNPYRLHLCEMPQGYLAPQAIVKLFYEAVVLGDSQSGAVGFLMRLLRGTRVCCGRCRTTIRCQLWSRGAARRLHTAARTGGRAQLEHRVLEDYTRLRPTCPTCGLTARLAHIKLLGFEDHAIALLPRA